MGVIYLERLRKRGLVKSREADDNAGEIVDVGSGNESIDSFTVQFGIVFAIYAVAYFMMHLLSLIGMKSTFFGFNFLVATLMAVLFKAVSGLFLRKGAKKAKSSVR